MNLSTLFEMQKELDQHIIQEKGLEGQDLLDKKILALQVELGELANEWQMFKFWKENPKPRTRVERLCTACEGDGFDRIYGVIDRLTPCAECNGKGVIGESSPLLEEYVDCLHFILSIGLDLGRDNWEAHYSKVAVHFGGDEITTQFNELFRFISNLRTCLKDEQFIWYGSVFSNFLGLGEMLGFTWEQIEQAYFEKNKVNHERQENGY